MSETGLSRPWQACRTKYHLIHTSPWQPVTTTAAGRLGRGRGMANGLTDSRRPMRARPGRARRRQGRDDGRPSDVTRASQWSRSLKALWTPVGGPEGLGSAGWGGGLPGAQAGWPGCRLAPADDAGRPL